MMLVFARFPLSILKLLRHVGFFVVAAIVQGVRDFRAQRVHYDATSASLKSFHVPIRGDPPPCCESVVNLYFIWAGFIGDLRKTFSRHVELSDK